MQRQEHGGNIYKMTTETENCDLLDFSANINPLGAPGWLRSVVNRELENIVHYPDPDSSAFCHAAATYHRILPENVVAGNGTAELMYAILRLFTTARIVVPVPSYVDYFHAAVQSGNEVITVPLSVEDGFQLNLKHVKDILSIGDLVVIATPNNPTGISPDTAGLRQLIEERNDVWFVIDEAFLDFIPKSESLAGRYDNVITLNSMTKFYALPGLRVGYCTCPPHLKEKIKDIIPPWSVNSIAQAVGVAALQDSEFQKTSIETVQKLRADFYTELQKLPGVTVYPSQVNYHLCRLAEGGDSAVVREKLLACGIAIRPCANFMELDERYFRVAVRNKEENSRFIRAISTILAPQKTAKKSAVQRVTPALMLQGTCSNAGKSVLAAALCRILVQDGVSVAPFKSQNMSLNSFVTLDGGEMGRAQVVQAQAARLLPDWRMNPILLKPNSDIGSQVIVEGHAVGNMTVREYHKYKKTAWEKVRRTYDGLSAGFQAMILEGAGSPGEVNLKKHDIVNMRMAEYAEAPVLLVGDIDRGGVYASFVGIMSVLEEWERNCIAGFVVNRFRGDARLLQSAHTYVKDFTGKNVLGVVPYIPHLGLPEEDSVSFKEGVFNREKPVGEHITISLINLPHISNFTDFEPFLEEPDVHLQVVSTVDGLAGSDLVLLPGSKNVIGDIKFLEEHGFVGAIQRFAEDGGAVVGVCGGYQMLGQKVSDAHAIESDMFSIAGLKLLQIETEILPEKNLLRKQGVHNRSGCDVAGYEIHHGISHGESDPLFSFDDSTACGHGNGSGSVWGVYLHGLFDADHFRRWFIDELRTQKGYAPVGKIVYSHDLEPAFDHLADTVRGSLDMDHIYSLLNL